jgi:hypothetical protein
MYIEWAYPRYRRTHKTANESNVPLELSQMSGIPIINLLEL